jgi:hypothetical protein
MADRKPLFVQGPAIGPRQTAQVLNALPPEYYTGLGAVAFRYSGLEHYMMQPIYLVVGIDRQLGRSVIREPRLHERLDILCDALFIRNISLSFDFKRFRNDLVSISEDRNRLVHGVWTENPETAQYMVGLTGGSWTPQGDRVKRKIRPEAYPIHAGHFNDILLRIEEAESKIQLILLKLSVVLGTSPETLRPKDAPRLRS